MMANRLTLSKVPAMSAVINAIMGVTQPLISSCRFLLLSTGETTVVPHTQACKAKFTTTRCGIMDQAAVSCNIPGEGLNSRVGTTLGLWPLAFCAQHDVICRVSPTLSHETLQRTTRSPNSRRRR